MSHSKRSSFRTVGMAALALGVLLVPTRTSFAAEACARYAETHRQSIPVRELGEWQPLGDNAILIWTPNSGRAHLVQLSTPMQGLQDATELTLVGGPNLQAIVACGHDAVLIDGDPATRTRIASIQTLSAQRAAQLARPVLPPQWQ